MRLKEGVSLANIVPQIVFAAFVADECYKRRGLECVITSANDSKHSAHSLHHSKIGKYTDGMCRAIDLRTHYVELNSFEIQLVNELKDRLGPDFDVVLEGVGTPQEHVHIEWDPPQ